MSQASREATAELPAPSELAGYRAVAVLGGGAGGRVYEVRGRHDEPLAVKVIPGAAPRTTEDAQRLRGQVRALALIDHPRLVRVYDLAPAGRDLCMVMELVPGPSLRDVFLTRRPSPDEVTAWVTQLAEAIDYLHLLGIVHRDVKPANVLLCDDGTVKLADLAVAGVAPVQGTPAYMAPELVRGDRVVDGRADVYSLATIAYEGLVGLPPFHGRDAEEVMAAQLRTVPPDPRTHVAGFPAPVGEVLLGGLAKQPEERPETAGAFAEALAVALSGRRPPSSRAIVPLTRGAEEAFRTRPAPLPATEPRARPMPRRIAALPPVRRMSQPMFISGLILILLAVAAFGYGGYVAYQHFTTPPTLRVSKVAFTANPTQVQVSSCGAEATFHFTGTITTNGAAGHLHWQWTQNGNVIGNAEGTRQVTANHHQIQITQTLYLNNLSTITVPVVFQVTSPNHQQSDPVPITYHCP